MNMQVITHGTSECHMDIPETLFFSHLPRTESGLYYLSSGEVLCEETLLKIQAPFSEVGKIECNLKNFYLFLMMDRIKQMVNFAKPVEFRWKGRGIGDFESETPEELAALYSAAYCIALNDPKDRFFNHAFCLFHIEQDEQGGYVLDLSQSRLSRLYVEKEENAFSLSTLRRFAECLRTAYEECAPNQNRSIKEKKRQFIALLKRLAKGDPLRQKAFEDLYRENCYGLWS
jgi:hypothetical protein